MITTTAMQVLAQCTVDGNTVVINSGQLDRKLYEVVNKVLDAIGGKWNRKVKGHIFDYDPSDALASVVSTGEVPGKNPLAYFPSPPTVVKQMIDGLIRFGLDDIHTILEPSAGNGAIIAGLKEYLPEHIRITAVEVDPARVATLQQYFPEINVVQADFLQWQPEHQFDAIMMNPPFRTPDRPLAYVDHVEHALALRKDPGLLVAVTPIGWQFTGSRRRLVQFRETVESSGYHHDLPENAFAASGTNVRTCLTYFGS